MPSSHPKTLFSHIVLWNLTQAFALCGAHPIAQQVIQLRTLNPGDATYAAAELALKSHLEQIGAMSDKGIDFGLLRGCCSLHLREELRKI